MKAVVVHEFGNSDVLRLEELPDPVPGAGEVVIDVTAAALNHLDVDVREGVSRFPIELPHTSASSRSAGSPTLGEGVEGWQVGDRVAAYLIATCGNCVYCRTGRESLCTAPDWFIGMGTGGGYAEQVRVQGVAADPDPGRRHRRRGRGEQHRLRHRLAHARHARAAPARRDRARQLGRQRDRLGRGADREARGRVRDRHLEQGRQAGQAAELGLDVGINYTTQDVVEEVHARHRRPRRRRRLRARAAASTSRRGSTRWRRTGGS